MPNELSDVTENEFEMYKGLLIDPSGGDEALKKQEIPEARLTIPTTPLPDSLDWREYGEFNILRTISQDLEILVLSPLHIWSYCTCFFYEARI